MPASLPGACRDRMATVNEVDRAGGGAMKIGDIFAQRYEILALLGRGGMGAVYRARDLALGETIALKLLMSGPEAAPLQILRFREEVRLGRRVTHPNVARVYDIGEEGSVLYLTMELVEGEDLRALLRRETRLPPEHAARIARALCDGLGAAHAAGVVHRDLKPANVLLAAGGRVVIGDFGIARSLTDAVSLTVGAIGTPSYMAPEQLTSSPIDGRTDLYALGLVLHEMLTGARPNAGPDRLASLCPPALAELVQRCLAHDPASRPSSAAEVARLLELAVPEIDAEPLTLKPAALTATRVDAPGPSVTAGDLPATVMKTAGAVPPAPLPWATGTGEAAARVLGVLPFRYRGPPAQDYMGDAITDELVDVLSRTRGLRVLGSGATARYRDTRDPRAMGADLGATAVIDGAVQLSGEQVRITVRLLETAGGVQLWSERYDGALAEIFALEETIAHRVAEALRVEITTQSHRGTAPVAAIEHYLAARHRLRADDIGDALAAVTALESCLELAPDFAPARAAHAIACLRAWYVDFESGTKDWGAVAGASVERALARAPELAETHLAAGIHATNQGDYRTAARSLERALSIAPTYAAAQEYLGMLQCEAGRAEEGVRRLEQSIILDPTQMFGGMTLARAHGLAGRFDRCDAVLADLERRVGPAALHLTASVRMRMAAWRGDRGGLRRWRGDHHTQGPLVFRFIALYANVLLGEAGEVELRRDLGHMLSTAQNPRFLTFVAQLATEIYCGIGQPDEARLHLMRAATSVLVDLEWLDGCPLLAPLRGHPGFAEARGRVRARAATIWMT